MGLLDKLEQVEIKADSRLPEDDLMFCETQQQAYDESCRALREIRQQWKKAIQAQRDLLGNSDKYTAFIGCDNYRAGWVAALLWKQLPVRDNGSEPRTGEVPQ